MTHSTLFQSFPASWGTELVMMRAKIVLRLEKKHGHGLTGTCGLWVMWFRVLTPRQFVHSPSDICLYLLLFCISFRRASHRSWAFFFHQTHDME